MVEFFAIVVFVVAALAGLYWRWTRKVDAEIAEGAAIEWAHLKRHEPDIVEGYDEARFRDVYRRVHFPRFPAYALACLASFGLALPVIFALLAMSQWAGERLGLIAPPLEIVRRVNLGEAPETQPFQCNAECQLYVAEAFSGFYFFFGVMISWLAIVAFFMRRYHKRSPGYLREELIRAREDMGDEKKTAKTD